MKSLKQVWSRNLPPPVAESGRRRLETARSAFGATMRVSRVGSPMFPYCSKEKAVSEQDAKHPTIETGADSAKLDFSRKIVSNGHGQPLDAFSLRILAHIDVRTLFVLCK